MLPSPNDSAPFRNVAEVAGGGDGGFDGEGAVGGERGAAAADLVVSLWAAGDGERGGLDVGRCVHV